VKRLERVSEDEIISEFLRAEFYQKEFDKDRRQFEQIVYRPNLENEAENSLRRALLYRRRATMWRELPADTRWYEVDFSPEDSERVNVFPRAQWRSIARGNFRAQLVAEKIRAQFNCASPSPLALKIQALMSLMEHEGPRSTVLLIGLDEHRPLTLLEGNHRFVASLLLPPEIMLRRIRIVCGLSSHMEDCCWYKTSLPSLSHYLKNRIKHFWNREADVSRWLPQAETTAPANTLTGTAAGASSAKSD
jgi:hypothetical protein